MFRDQIQVLVNFWWWRGITTIAQTRCQTL